MESQEEPSVVRSSKLSVVGRKSPSGSCPDCLLPLRRLSIEEVMAGGNTAWTQCFADKAHGLSPGRYRCNGCLTEWWQFPIVAAS
jgi:hypothetical protein